MRVLVIFLSILLFAYAAISLSLGLGQPGVEAPKWCELGLCPEEFSDAKVIRLIREAREPENKTAIKELTRAVVQDSASAYAWANLGDGLANARDFEKAKYCFERARAAGPRSPIILLRAGNFDFALGNYDQVMADLRPVLVDPELSEYYDPIFLTYSRTPLPIERILEQGVPPTRVPGQAFLRYLMANGNLPNSQAAWKWLLQRRLSDDRLTGEYVGFLTQQKQESLAVETWVQVNHDADPAFRKSNWVYNSDFARTPKPSLFDWHLEATDDVSVARGPNRGVKVTFAGKENVDFHGVWQQLVLPLGPWTATAQIRTEGVTTDEGIRLHVAGQGLDVKTDSLTGTRGLAEYQVHFVIGPQNSGSVRIEIERSASRRFDSKVAGSAWVDSIRVSGARGGT